MNRKSIGWVALAVCIAAVALASFGGRGETPQSAQAAASFPRYASAPAISPQTTQACQAVTDQVFIIHRVNVAEVNAKTLKPVAALDELVSLQSRIDKSECPADFRTALVRFIGAENAARIHAHLNKTDLSEAFFAASEQCIASRGLSAFSGANSSGAGNRMTLGREQQDSANIQSAFAEFSKIAIKYGVK
jgi:hypothetical protein